MVGFPDKAAKVDWSTPEGMVGIGGRGSADSSGDPTLVLLYLAILFVLLIAFTSCGGLWGIGSSGDAGFAGACLTDLYLVYFPAWGPADEAGSLSSDMVEGLDSNGPLGIIKGRW